MSGRKVHFSVPIHQIEYLDKQWENASCLARDGSDWIRMGLDRQRFRDRIERTAEILKDILDFEFRLKIYHERFENFVIPEQQAKTSEINSIADKIIATTTTPKSEITAATKTTIKTNHITAPKQFIEPKTASSKEKQQPSLKQRKTQQTKRAKRRKRRNKSRQKHRGGHRRKR